MSTLYEVTHSAPVDQDWYADGCRPKWWGIWDVRQRRYVAQCPTREAALAALRLLSAETAVEPKPARCPKYSRAWNCQCDLYKGHGGQCVSKGDAFCGSLLSGGES